MYFMSLRGKRVNLTGYIFIQVTTEADSFFIR